MSHTDLGLFKTFYLHEHWVSLDIIYRPEHPLSLSDINKWSGSRIVLAVMPTRRHVLLFRWYVGGLYPDRHGLVYWIAFISDPFNYDGAVGLPRSKELVKILKYKYVTSQKYSHGSHFVIFVMVWQWYIQVIYLRVERPWKILINMSNKHELTSIRYWCMASNLKALQNLFLSENIYIHYI